MLGLLLCAATGKPHVACAMRTGGAFTSQVARGLLLQTPAAVLQRRGAQSIIFILGGGMRKRAITYRLWPVAGAASGFWW